jgi:hypothetical protein
MNSTERSAGLCVWRGAAFSWISDHFDKCYLHGLRTGSWGCDLLLSHFPQVESIQPWVGSLPHQANFWETWPQVHMKNHCPWTWGVRVIIFHLLRGLIGWEGQFAKTEGAPIINTSQVPKSLRVASWGHLHSCPWLQRTALPAWSHFSPLCGLANWEMFAACETRQSKPCGLCPSSPVTECREWTSGHQLLL